MNKLKQPKPKLFFDTRGIGSTVLFLAALVNYLGVQGGTSFPPEPSFYYQTVYTVSVAVMI